MYLLLRSTTEYSVVCVKDLKEEHEIDSYYNLESQFQKYKILDALDY